MTSEQIAGLGPALNTFLGGFKPCFVTNNTFGHCATYCRGLLSDLPRKSVVVLRWRPSAKVPALPRRVGGVDQGHFDGPLRRREREPELLPGRPDDRLRAS